MNDLNNATLPANEPEHLVCAEKWANELIVNFSPDLQNEIINYMKNRIVDHRHAKISENQQQIESYQASIENLNRALS
jgi:hypothetical protein